MLRLLLDEHITPAVAQGLSRRDRTIATRFISEWEDGKFLGQKDSLILQEAAVQKLTLVTYDCRTIMPLLKIWGEEGLDHGGVIFLGEKSIPSANLGDVVRALIKLVSETRNWDWNNRIYFLRPERQVNT